MNAILPFLSAALSIAVGVISLVMAGKCLFSKKLVSFHEKAAGMPWGKVDPALQAVILALMRVSGFGFLAVGLLTTVSPIVNRCQQNVFTQYIAPSVAVLFCAGLFWTNYELHMKTKSPTPWKGALAAVVMLLASMALSCAG
jgi:hypothetical protein